MQFLSLLSFIVFSKAFLTAFLAFLGGCASWDYPRPGPTCDDMTLQTLSNPAERINFEDFSILPPQGPNWCIGGLDKKGGGLFVKNQWAGQILQKRPEPWQTRQTLTVFVGVDHPKEKIDDPEALEKLIKEGPSEKRIKSGPPTPGVNMDNLTVERDHSISGATCFKIEGTITGALSQTTPEAPFALYDRRLVCKHPSKPMVITIGYGERYLQTPKPAFYLSDKYKSELEPFINSLQFKP